MPTTTLRPRDGGRLRVFAAALLVAALTLSGPACGGNDNQTANTENVNNTNNQVGLMTPTQSPTPQEDITAMSQDPIADNLVDVLHTWSGIELAQLERKTPLSSMWFLNHSSERYDKEGIRSLILKIQNHHFFKSTPGVKDRAGQLSRGLFLVGGRIQNQGDLHDFLAS
ncbi:MAG TPA: hypothetical protein VF538_12090 [Pyrinomonadaceae bacterium]|jgi:hypothetical protein